MKKFLKFIFVIQEVSNRGRNPKIGRGLQDQGGDYEDRGSRSAS